MNTGRDVDGLTKEDLQKIDKEVNSAKNHDEWYFWQRIRDALNIAIQRRKANKASQKLRELVKELMLKPTISTTQVLVVLYAEFPELQTRR